MGFIYKITNKTNAKSYIGQTKRDYNVRIHEHFRDAYRPKSLTYNTLFHRAIRKYGINNFDITILEQCENNQLDAREQYWIEFYSSFPDGYNMNAGGNQVNAKIFDYYDIYQAKINESLNASELSERFNCSKATIQAALKSYGLTKSEISRLSANRRNKTVFSYNPNTKIYQVFDSIASASKETLVARTNINKALKNEIKSAGEYLWGNTQAELQIKIDAHTNLRPLAHQLKIDKYSLKNEYLTTYDSLTEALASVGKPANSGGITNNLKGRAKSAYGFIWKYNSNNNNN